MSTNLTETQSPILDVQRSAVGQLSSHVFDSVDAQTWEELSEGDKRAVYETVWMRLGKTGLVPSDAPARLDILKGQVVEEFERGTHLLGSADAYRSGIRGLAVNNVISSLARMELIAEEPQNVEN